MEFSPAIHWKIDECALYFERMKVRGWGYHPTKTVVALELVLDKSGQRIPLRSFGAVSPDIAAVFGPRAENVRFDEWIQGSAWLGTPFSIVFRFADGGEEVGSDGLTNAAGGDPYYQSWENFIQALDQFESGAVLEIGSRARSAISRKHRIPDRLEYVGLDILAGPNVDVIGDAHELAALFPDRKFVAAFSTSVFEHLLMPWKVALEFNSVLELGGIVYTATHQTWPLHEEPWDFWRFSRDTWRALFNPASGFEILEAVMGEPARVHACRTSEITKDMACSPAYLGSASLVRKVAPAAAAWPAPRQLGVVDLYPGGELSTRPTADRV
jgi:hypothetical protein